MNGLCWAPLVVAVLLMSSLCNDRPADPEVAADALAVADDPELESAARAMLPDIARLSGLEIREPVRLARERPDQVRAYVAAQLEAELPPAEIEGMRKSYSLLGLLPDTLDLRTLLTDLYAEQIVGYYDPDRRMLFVIEDVGRDEYQPVLAHELVHALQDQHTNLDSLIARDRGNDRQMAAQAALEGHATLVMFTLLAEQATGAAVDPGTVPNPGPQLRAALESPSAQFPVFRRAPPLIRETLLFPYAAGSDYVQSVWRSVNGHPAPLDTLLPQSTEQVLYPAERFLDRRDAPVEVRFDADQTLYENTLGAFETGLFLEAHLGQGADSLARGWGGDRYRLYDTPGGAALVWQTVWDDDAAAARFRAAIHSIIDGADISAAIEDGAVSGRAAVRIVIGESTAAVAAAPRPHAHIGP